MTIAEALNVSQRSISSREAEIFLQDVLDVERSWLHAHLDQELTPEKESAYLAHLEKREQNHPVAHIIGHKEFYGRRFSCDARALIPRPETEGLIDKAIAWLPDYFKTHTKESNKPCPVRILELGTGCGNIAVTLALELAKKEVPSQIIATDISEEALELAKQNWQQLKDTSNWPVLQFIQADLFDHALIPTRAPYHLIIANLPYVPDEWKFNSEAQAEVVFREPDIALFGGEDGLDIYRRFFEFAPTYLAKDGRVLIEFGETETADILPLAKKAFPDRSSTIYKDYAGLDRTLEII